MRQIRSFEDLEQFGIHALTGEACGFSMRLLCDVTEQGKNLVEKYFGGTIEIRKDSNMNSGRGGPPHVGSVMLPRQDFVQQFGIFCLLYTSTDKGALIASVTSGYHGDTFGIEYSSKRMEDLRKSWANSDDSEIRVGDCLFWDSGEDSWLILVKEVLLHGDHVRVLGADGKVHDRPRSEFKIEESSLFRRKFADFTCLEINRIYQRSSNPGSKDRNVHAMTGRIE